MSACPYCNGTGVVEPRTEFWLIQAEGFGTKRSLAYWGPFRTKTDAKASYLHRPELGTAVVEVPT